MKMKSTYEKPSEKKKRVQTENLKRIKKLQKEGFFKVMKMKSTYEKPSEKKKRIQTENIKRIKKLQKLKNRY